MRIPRVFAGLPGIAILALYCGIPAAAQSLRLPAHERIVLKNGLTVLLMEKRGVPIVSFAAIVKTGAAADPAGQDGLASATAGLLRKGTKARTAQQFAADLDFIGGTFDAEASADFTSISAEFLTKDLARGLGLFMDALLHPAFPQTEVDKLLAQSIDGVKGAKDDAQNVILLYYYGYLYGARPYGRPDGGDEDSLKHVQREGIVRGTISIQAPTKFELVSPDNHRTINYLHTTSVNLDLRRYKGLRIIVTGEEGLDERWRNTPVITIQRIQVIE